MAIKGCPLPALLVVQPRLFCQVTVPTTTPPTTISACKVVQSPAVLTSCNVLKIYLISRYTTFYIFWYSVIIIVYVHIIIDVPSPSKSQFAIKVGSEHGHVLLMHS
ncbi:MAG: hypothetical protein IPN46_20150 [Saprospiraceae bacterium]|nr:hypothetical protein [Saprospiraceae bacterium]